MSMAREATTSPAWLVLTAFVTLAGILAVAVPSTLKVLASDTPAVNVSNVAEPASIGAPNDGTDALRPALAPADRGFVDTRGGWGWGDKCRINIKAQHWGWARAECDQAMRIQPASPQPMASLLYNQALISIHMGDTETARSLLQRSLQLREHPEVRAVYQNLR